MAAASFPWRRLRFVAWLLFSLAAIGIAVLIALTRLLLPLLVADPVKVGDWIGSRIDREVSIAHVSGGWVGRGPQLTLSGVDIAIGDGVPPIHVPRAELAIDLTALLPGRSLSTFRLIGLDVELLHHEDGRWQVSGFQGSGESKLSMGALGALVLSDLRVRVRDVGGRFDLALGSPGLRVRSSGSRLQFNGSAQRLDTDSAPVQVIAEMDQTRGSGHLYMGALDTDVGRIGQGQQWRNLRMLSGRGDMQGWIRWQGQRIVDARAHVDMSSVVIGSGAAVALNEHVEVEPRAHLPRLAFSARLLRDGDVLKWDVIDLQLGEYPPAAVSLRHALDGTLAAARVEALPIAPLADVAMLVGELPHELRRWLYQASIQGIVAGEAQWRGGEDFDAQLAVDGLVVQADGFIPGVRLEHATLRADANSVLLQLPPQPVELRLPGVFRRPFLFAPLAGDISAWRQDGGWQLGTDRLAFDGEEYRGELQGSVLLAPGESPFLDLQAVVTEARVPAAKLFWPVNVLGEAAVEWLDDALVSGTVVHGRAVMRGPASGFPFDDNSGRFEAIATVADAVLDYHPDWPRAEGIAAVASFINAGMRIGADAGHVMGNEADAATATVEDFSESPLLLAVSGGGTGPQLLDFLRATPIGAEHAEVLDAIRVGGRGQLGFKLHLPLGEPDEQVQLSGGVDLRGAALDHDGYDLHFTGATGRVAFDQDGFRIRSMAMRHGDADVELDMASGIHTGDDGVAFSADLRGVLSTVELLQRVPQFAPAQALLSGDARWHVGLRVPVDSGGNADLVLESDLDGLAIALPAPVGKAAAGTVPLRLDLPLPLEGSVIHLNMGRRLALAARPATATQPLAAHLHLGARRPDTVPSRGVIIDGRTPRLDVDAWLAAVDALGADDHGNGNGEALAGLRSANVHIEDLLVGGRRLGAMRIAMQPSAAAWRIDLDGTRAAGHVEMPQPPSAQPLVANLRHLHWPDTTGQAGQGSPTRTVPRSVPALQIDIDDLRVGAMQLGQLSWRSTPDAVGMHIDKLQIRSPQMTIDATGAWTGSAAANTSRLRLQLTAGDLGDMLDSLGFSGLIDGGRTQVESTLRWPGAPVAFDMATLDGELDVRVAEGRILDVEPGAGRVFGLLSLREIPRRLSLDFSDFFRSGMSFTSIAGHFDLRDGNAHTDGLVIDSPAAHILITGRTGLRDKDYDQQMVVTPRAGATLPVVGAIAGGPVGAAAGIVMQGILSKPIGEATRSRYHVGGSWEEPVIVLQARDAAPPPARPPARP